MIKAVRLALRGLPYKDRGRVVPGFPSNDFAQELGGNNDIADFCRNSYGVKVPMFSKGRLRGANTNSRHCTAS
jgi:glutathione peroxidase